MPLFHVVWEFDHQGEIISNSLSVPHTWINHIEFVYRHVNNIAIYLHSLEVSSASYHSQGIRVQAQSVCFTTHVVH